MNNDRVYYSHDSEIHAVREMSKLMVLCLMVGLGIGAIVAVLFSPLSGKQVREDLSKTVEEGLNNGREAVKPVVKRVEKEIGDLQKNVEDRLK